MLSNKKYDHWGHIFLTMIGNFFFNRFVEIKIQKCIPSLREYRCQVMHYSATDMCPAIFVVSFWIDCCIRIGAVSWIFECRHQFLHSSCCLIFNYSLIYIERLLRVEFAEQNHYLFIFEIEIVKINRFSMFKFIKINSNKLQDSVLANSIACACRHFQ